LQHETFCTERPSTVAVQHSDHDGHISATDTGGGVHAEQRAGGCRSTQQSETGLLIGIVEEHAHHWHIGTGQYGVRHIATGQLQSTRGQ
jgi:hypothetical protein